MIASSLYCEAMKKIQENLFKNVEKIAKTVKQDFVSKGVVPPTRDAKGNVVIGKYTIKRRKDGYHIEDRRGIDVTGAINLAETAAVIANDLALGRWLDQTLINEDRWYGYKTFEEEQALQVCEHRRKKNDHDLADISLYKAQVAGRRRIKHKKVIDDRFDKLRKLT